jgi:hypothetical protein
VTGNNKGIVLIVAADQGKYIIFNLARVLHLLRGRPSVQYFLRDGTGEDPRRGFVEGAYA